MSVGRGRGLRQCSEVGTWSRFDSFAERASASVRLPQSRHTIAMRSASLCGSRTSAVPRLSVCHLPHLKGDVRRTHLLRSGSPLHNVHNATGTSLAITPIPPTGPGRFHETVPSVLNTIQCRHRGRRSLPRYVFSAFRGISLALRGRRGISIPSELSGGLSCASTG